MSLTFPECLPGRESIPQQKQIKCLKTSGAYELFLPMKCALNGCSYASWPTSIPTIHSLSHIHTPLINKRCDQYSRLVFKIKRFPILQWAHCLLPQTKLRFNYNEATTCIHMHTGVAFRESQIVFIILLLFCHCRRHITTNSSNEIKKKYYALCLHH